MPKLEYFVVAEAALVDQLTNRVSVFNIYDELTVPAFPHVQGQFVSVCSWNATEGDKDKDFQVGLELRSPEVTHGPFTSNFTMKRSRHRSIMTLNSIPISQPGEIVFEITLNGKHEAFHTIDVKKIEG